jgi:pantoate--beta-alanine ligase
VPIERSSRGLALSSRNERLNNEQKEIALNLSQVLFDLTQVKNAGFGHIEKLGIEKLNSVEGLELEYFRVVDEETLLPPQNDESGVKKRMFVAAYVGDVRLIDNHPLN